VDIFPTPESGKAHFIAQKALPFSDKVVHWRVRRRKAAISPRAR